jgi:cytidylate kinase
MLPVVAIDGISGSGKSSTARLLAKALGYRHLDTGAMYRMHSLSCLQKRLPPDQADEVAAAARKLEFSYGESGDLRVNGQALPVDIRSAEVSAVVSEYCRHPEVRAFLVRQQRKLGLSHSSVVEGRDIGTVVFPDAPWKFYMTARPEIRARRRADELERAGLPGNYADILQNLTDRDAKDSTRTHSPLQKAPDALEIDTSDYTLDQQVAMLAHLVRKGPLS